MVTIQGGRSHVDHFGISNREQTTDPVTVAERIRKAILDGDFSPNQRMVEADLCEEFHASRGAVRAALLDLTNQGLIERIQNRGARVRSVSLAEAIEITEVRMVVEGLCAAKAAENITEAEIVELKQLREGMISAVDAGNCVRLRRSPPTVASPNPADQRPTHRRRHPRPTQRPDGASPLQTGDTPRAGSRSPSPNTWRSSTRSAPASPDEAEAVMRDHLRSVITGLRAVAAAALQ